ncbi:MAG: permease-like cell division protein FtsX [Elusimicrobiales bacterium]|jgi:cell division protein FtsX|nr:permease-like cell division protein FtsX [Elusimicrobiales bacterium]HOL61776.1 permease-like cell division protein FtsX [Elusimicrobiales bacterium]HPO94628.1 permease-like cell division protein FtsX [Elusimicrobiales bacterium]
MSNYAKKGYRIVFLATLIFGIYFEAVSFFYFQTSKISKMLINDFRIVAALKKQASVEDTVKKISLINGITSVNFVKSEESLKRIQNEDNELYLSIKSMALNPVPDILEISVDPIFMGNIDVIVQKISDSEGVMDIRYKPDELVAIMHTLFYSKFLFLIIGATIVIIGITVFSAVLHVGFSNFFASIMESIKWFLNGMFGSLIAVVFIYILIYPIKYISPLWEWPSAPWHIITLLFGGLMGWVLYQWKRN